MGSRNIHSSGPFTRDLFIPEIMFRTSCPIHEAAKDEFCFTVPNLILEGKFHGAICNARAMNAGMIGSISHSSLVRHVPKALRDGR